MTHKKLNQVNLLRQENLTVKLKTMQQFDLLSGEITAEKKHQGKELVGTFSNCTLFYR